MVRTSQRLELNTAIILAVFLVALDRAAKVFALFAWKENPIVIVNNFLSLSLSKNPLVAFSLDTRINPLVLIIPIIVALLVYLTHTLKQRNWHEAAALSVIIMGAMSNLYDRFVYGYVIDYIDLHPFTVFNVADAMITLGVVWLSFQLIIRRGIDKNNK